MSAPEPHSLLNRDDPCGRVSFAEEEIVATKVKRRESVIHIPLFLGGLWLVWHL